MNAPAIASPAPSKKLGEELPIFCERCGYSLHGLPIQNCDQCRVLQLHCPECGHHQPINTLRPVVQRVLGRVRSVWLVGVVLFKLGVFVAAFFSWFGAGGELAYQHYWVQVGQGGKAVMRTVDLGFEVVFLTVILSSIYAFFTRLLLLRWARSVLVAIFLAAFAAISMTAGALVRGIEWARRNLVEVDGLGFDFAMIVAIAVCTIFIVALSTWPIWTVLVRAFLPRRTGTLLLEYQRSLSAAAPDLARQQLGVR